MADSHIMKQHAFNFHRSDQYELLNLITYKPRKCDSSQDYALDSLYNYHDWNESPNMNDTTDSGVNIVEATIANQEHQNYYDRQYQQYIARKYNGGLQ